MFWYNFGMTHLDQITQDLTQIKQRNKLVEVDKKWERSATRKLLLMIFTYLAIGLYLQAIDVEEPWISAVVPSIGFLLSTLSLPFFRRMWERYIYKA